VKGLVTDAEKRRIHLEGMFEGIVDLVGHFKPIFAVSIARAHVPAAGTDS
jgi:hypothetical protein